MDSVEERVRPASDEYGVRPASLFFRGGEVFLDFERMPEARSPGDPAAVGDPAENGIDVRAGADDRLVEHEGFLAVDERFGQMNAAVPIRRMDNDPVDLHGHLLKRVEGLRHVEIAEEFLNETAGADFAVVPDADDFDVDDSAGREIANDGRPFERV